MGIIRYTKVDGAYEILSNPRKTFIPPAGHGFLPRETAWHHQQHIVALVKLALEEAKLSGGDLTAICYTKGKQAGRSSYISTCPALLKIR